MVTIIFEAHSTSLDNEAGKASGWNDVELSELGTKQSHELGERYKDNLPNVVFCSDLQRSYKTAEIAFGNKVPIIKDQRLRECNYGDLTQALSDVVAEQKPKRINEPFPNGESYEQTAERMKSFLDDLKVKHEGDTVMIIGHRATQYGLERWINGKSLEKCITDSWQWQPGWKYEL